MPARKKAGPAAYRVFEAGDVKLQSGRKLPGAFVAYRTYGALNAARDNVIVFPTHFGATHLNNEYLIGRKKALDPEKYFIVTPNLIGNGLSLSPSNAKKIAPGKFPIVSILDNVRLQYRLLTESLGVRSVALVVGHSLGSMQAFHWGAAYPDFVQRIAPICGAARISAHNFVFVEGMRRILALADLVEEKKRKKFVHAALAATGRAWAAWPPSAHFYRERLYERLGFAEVEDFLENYWQRTFQAMGAGNVLCQIATWEAGNIAEIPPYGGNFEAALASIRARAIVMPSEADAYFPPEDSAYEVKHMKRAELRTIPSHWGHWAGSGRNPADIEFIDDNLKELLGS